MTVKTISCPTYSVIRNNKEFYDILHYSLNNLHKNEEGLPLLFSDCPPIARFLCCFSCSRCSLSL